MITYVKNNEYIKIIKEIKSENEHMELRIGKLINCIKEVYGWKL